MKRITALLLTLAIFFTFIPLASAAQQFDDVPSSAWFAEAVCWAVDNGVTSGTSETTFSPNKTCSRSEILTFLYRLDGSPEVSYSELPSSVTDLPNNRYYTKPFVWAIKNGIIYPQNGKVCPNAKVTRGDIAFYIYNYAVYAGLAEPNYEKTILNYSDVFENVNSIPTWLQSAISYCLDNNIMTGRSETDLALACYVTRAEAIAVIYRTSFVKQCGGHKLTYLATQAPSCKYNGYDLYQCSKCNALIMKNWTPAHGHDFSCAELVSEATFSTPTRYRFVCSYCKEKTKVRELGKSILAYPNPGRGTKPKGMETLSWGTNTGNGKKTITLYSGTDSKVTLTRKWFGSAWVYIADIQLNNANAYSKFKGFSAYNPSTNQVNKITAYNKVLNTEKAVVMISGDAEIYNDWDNIRGGVIYGRKTQSYTSAPASYWNPSNGTFGMVADLGLGVAPELTTLASLGITDTIRFGGTWINNHKLTTSLVDGLDYDESSYQTQNARRQTTFMGIKKSQALNGAGSVIHVYLVVADGNPYTNIAPSSDTTVKMYSSDAASYGLSLREKKLLMATLGCDFAIGLDGGGSTSMAVRYNNKVYQVNGIQNWQDGSVRKLWDMFGFEK